MVSRHQSPLPHHVGCRRVVQKNDTTFDWEAGQQDRPLTLAKEAKMIPLYQEPYFTFRFDDNRVIQRFHLESVEAGRQVRVFKFDTVTQDRLGLLATATVSEGGWVNLNEPIIMRAGEAFVAVPEATS